MPADMNDPFRDAAARPSREVPLATIERRLRTRRRQRIGAAAACGVLVAGLMVGAGVLLTGGSEPSVQTTHPAQSLASGGGATVDLPDGWVQSPLQGSPTPGTILAVGTTELGPGQQTDCAAGPEHATDAFVLVYDLRQLGAIDIPLHATARPADFASPHTDSQCPSSASTTTSSGPLTSSSAPAVGRVLSFVFTDGGRALMANVTLGPEAPANRQAEAFTVLNSLTVESSTPPTVDTTVPSTEPKSDDTRAITAAFLGWIDTKPPDADVVGSYVEDFDHIRASIRDAAATNGQPNSYTGRVDAITRISGNEADVTYSFLINGQVAVPDMQGKAVKINGVWKVSRDTACAAIAMGPTRCPPRG